MAVCSDIIWTICRALCGSGMAGEVQPADTPSNGSSRIDEMAEILLRDFFGKRKVDLEIEEGRAKQKEEKARKLDRQRNSRSSRTFSGDCVASAKFPPLQWSRSCAIGIPRLEIDSAHTSTSGNAEKRTKAPGKE